MSNKNQKKRENPSEKPYKNRENMGCAGEIMLFDNTTKIVKKREEP
jgi:hypothetical protein